MRGKVENNLYLDVEKQKRDGERRTHNFLR